MQESLHGNRNRSALDTEPESHADLLWLEEIDSAAVQEWVQPRSEATLHEAEADPAYRRMEADARSILDAADRIPWVQLRGDWAYNFWRDAEHPRGLWRRMPVADFLLTAKAGSPAANWQVLLDVDELAATENEPWVYAGTVVHRPEDERALCLLSRGGSDAVVVREFDISRGAFRSADEGGFALPEAKTSVQWLDADTLLVSSPLGEGHATLSGYGRTVRMLRRGEELSEAPVLWAGSETDVAAHITYDQRSGRALASRVTDFFSARCAYRLPEQIGLDAEAGWQDLPLPEDCRLAPNGPLLYLMPRTAMSLGGATIPAGSVAALWWSQIDEALAASEPLPAPTLLFQPNSEQALDSLTPLRDGVLIAVLDDMASRLTRYLAPEHPTEPWHVEQIDTGTTPADITVTTSDRFAHNHAFLATSTPVDAPSLLALEDEPEPRRIATTPARFAAENMTVERFHAVSADGTRVPYFVLRRTDLDGPRPTILYGYGGFEVSQKPAYAALRGKLWVEQGGTYVVAGIRGGGEYGPEWHAAALREKRPRAYEDFAAVAQDLVARRLTSTAQLGVTGGSNGGLLTGVMLTRYPELFGAIAIAMPLLDMRRYHLLLAGNSWRAEYGDPDGQDWHYLRQFSPLHNVRPSSELSYPPVLLTASTKDDRVHPAHARKMVALLERAGHDVRYFENIEGGHSGAADNAQEARKAALSYYFFARELGLPLSQ